MASLTSRARFGLGATGVSPAFLGVVLLAPAALALGRLLPEEGAGLGLRLTGAAACVLLLPGLLILRGLDWPARLGLAVAGSLVWSLAAVFLCLALTFAASGSLSLTVALLGIVAAGGLVASLASPPVETRKDDLLVIAGVAVAGLLLSGLVWWASTELRGDELLHLARARKLDEIPSLSSVEVVDEFRGGGPHPGYAFPLWHGVLALVARLGGVDPELVVLHLSALLAPLALVLAYAAGAALFASWAGGVATAAAVAAVAGFPRGGVGSFAFAAQPPAAARLLLVPALLALVFAFLRGRRWLGLASIGAAALGLAAVHPTDAVFVVLVLAAFALVRLLLAEHGRSEAPYLGASVAAVVLPLGLFVAWLWPVVGDPTPLLPSAAERATWIPRYLGHLDVFADTYRLAPEAITRAGAPAVAGLLAVAAAFFALRRRWAAFVLGATLAVLLVLLTPPLFTLVADLGTLSQARRLAFFLPLPFALAGAALLLGRFRILGCAAALAAGVGLELAYEGDYAERLITTGGPAWPVWVAGAVAVSAIAAGRFLRGSGTAPTWWGAAVALLFVTPIAVAGLQHVEREQPDPHALPAGLVQALRTEVPARATVFADLETSYRLAAEAPLHVAALPPAHASHTSQNRVYERRGDVLRFFYRKDVDYLEKALILSSYGSSWLVVDRAHPVPSYVAFLPPPVYDDGRYALYRLRR